jgi:hypothetical protein
MAKKATHFGTCQVCRAVQKLPNGKLAKHGYTTRYGFFSGTCFGSDFLPLEISCELVKVAKKRALDRARDLREQAADYRALDYSDVTTAWVYVYRPAQSRYEQSGYRWEQQEIEAETKHYSDGEAYTIFYRVTPKGRNRIDTYSMDHATTVAEMARTLNEKYVRECLEKTAVQAEIYAKSCDEIIKNWKPAELQPIAA